MIKVNRKVKYDYEILDEYIGGLILEGSEVKSVRNGDFNILDSYAYISNNKVYVKNFKISKFKSSHSINNHRENRDKEILLNKNEINKIKRSLDTKGHTLVTIGILNMNNRLKIKLAVAKGKKKWDKKEAIKKRESDREIRKYI